MKNVKVIKKAAIFLMVFVLAFSSLSVAAAVTYSRGGKRVRYTGSSYKVCYNSKRKEQFMKGEAYAEIADCGR